MRKLLMRGPIAVGVAVVLALALFGIALAVLVHDPPTHYYPVTCSSPYWEVGKVIITNTHESETASGRFVCTDNGPPPNIWGGNWQVGPNGQSVIRGCATAYDLLTIDVYVDVNGRIGLDDIDHDSYANYCQFYGFAPAGRITLER